MSLPVSSRSVAGSVKGFGGLSHDDVEIKGNKNLKLREWPLAFWPQRGMRSWLDVSLGGVANSNHQDRISEKGGQPANFLSTKR